MVEAMKMAARIAAVAAIGILITNLVGTLIGVFVGAEGIGAITEGIGVAKAFINNWLPINGNLLIGVAMALISLEVGILAFKAFKVAQRVIFKVSEG